MSGVMYQIKYKNMANGRHEFQRWEKISESKARNLITRHGGPHAQDVFDALRYGRDAELPTCWIRVRTEEFP